MKCIQREHCQKAVEILSENGADNLLIHAVCCHGYGICSDVKQNIPWKKYYFATDELTGLIGAAALMRPSKSVQDMELKSLKRNLRIRNSLLVVHVIL